MDYQLTLAPDLGLSPADFVAVWNVTTECRATAEAHLLSQVQGHASKTPSSNERVILKRRAALDIPSHTIEHLIKEVLKREGVGKVAIAHQNMQDGTRLLMVSNGEK